jgi:hypothetical protein
MNLVISIEEVRKAIRVDFDHDTDELNNLAEFASSYLEKVTGYDFGKEDTIEPLAKQAARLLVRTHFFSQTQYNKDFDYSMGLGGLIVQLQCIAAEKLAAEAALEVVVE